MKNLRKAIVALLVIICVMTSICTIGVFAEGTNQVTAETSVSIQQGSGEYCYVYLDDLTDIASLTVAVHYDTDKVTVTDSYNQAACTLYDSSNQNGCLQYSYIFDGEGSNEKTTLFYFYYQVNENAAIGDTYFDVVVSDAYTAALDPVNISGSRCNFFVTEAQILKNCYIYGTDSVSTSVKEEFELTYYLYESAIASGSFSIQYDSELFAVVSVSKGGLLDGKLADINTNLDGTVAVSFVGTENNYQYDLITVKFKTLKNVTESSDIKLVVTDLYDKELNLYSCSGVSTTANIVFDESYTEDAPSMSVSSSYNTETGKVTATIKLEKDSKLGAGDFVLKFDTRYLTYISSEKGFSPTFFNINDKDAADGILKFSIISLSDITDEQIVLTVVFDVKHYCQDKTAYFELSGSGLTDSLVNTIPLNFVDSSVIIPLKHTAATAVEENRVEPTCTVNGSYDSVVYCSVCDVELSREKKSIDKLGHDYKTEWTTDLNPTCTTAGSKSHHCSRCGDKADITPIPANGHAYGDWYVVTAPTCTATGTEEHDCAVCYHKETKTTNALGHAEGEAVVENRVEPTCTVNGSYDSVVYCSVCDVELSREKKSIDKLGHDYKSEWTTDLNPTCTTEGSKSRHCTRCDDKADITPIPANGHSYGDWYETKAPTCTATGTDEHKCSVCQHTETRTTDALGHTNSAAVVENKVDATCTADGSYDSVVYCSVCNAELSREAKTIGKLGHDYETEWTEDVEPTCTTVGSKSHHCSRCDDKADITEIPANGHSYGDWYEIKTPTCTATGTDERKCSVCQHTETQTTNALGHTNAAAVVENKVDATCTADGSYDSVVYCSVCNAELSREAKTIGKLGHDYKTEWTEDVAPTCTTVGSKSHHCTRCDNKADVTEIPANGHSYLTDFVFDEANHWKECACGEKNEITAHTWNNGEVTKEATADEEGVKTYTCTLCSCTKNESIAKLVTNVKDTESGVTLEIPSNSQATLPAGTVIEVVEKSNESISEQILGEFAATAETVVEALDVYDINLLLDGVKIQPNGAVVVTLPAPKFTAEYDRIIVVFIADDGSYDECKTTVNADGTISFETDHFSKYAVIGVNEEEADDRIGVGAIIAIVVGAVLVVGGGAFVIYWFVIKKKNKPADDNATDAK